MKLPEDRIAVICRNHQIRKLSVFGSALRSDFNGQSDYDFLVEFDDKVRVGFLKLSAIRNELKEILKRDVDLVPNDSLKPLIRDNILRESRVIYEG